MADLAPATGAILRAILDSTYDIWCEGLTPAAYERYYRGQLATAWGARHLQRFALVDGSELLASAKQYTFSAMLDREQVSAVGIGAVFTQPAHRGRGRAREIVERLLERAAGAGADLTLLFSEIGADYYARLGFETIPVSTLTLRVIESVRHGAPATLVRGGDDRDLTDIAAMGELRARPSRFHLNRDRDLVQYAISKKRLLAGLGRPGLREVRFFVAEEGASAVAYVLITVDASGQWTLEECGDRDPAGARVGAILQALVARDAAEARPSISAWLPHGFCPPQVRTVEERPSAELMMVHPISARARAALPLRAEDVLYWHSDVF